jgi:hypothetical protein
MKDVFEGNILNMKGGRKMNKIKKRIIRRMAEIKEDVFKLDGVSYKLTMGTIQQVIELEKLKAQYNILFEQLQYIEMIEEEK